jgi:hypothetical protein
MTTSLLPKLGIAGIRVKGGNENLRRNSRVSSVFNAIYLF